MKRLSKWTSNKYIICAMHILFWILLIFPYFSGPDNPPYFEHARFRMVFNHSFVIVLFYFNAFYLFPRVYKRRGWLMYLFSLAITVAILISSSIWLRNQFLPGVDFPMEKTFGRSADQQQHAQHPNPPFRRPHGPRGGLPFPIYIFIIGISFSYRLIMDNNKEEKRRKEQETETLKTELNFLRSQISPHFMFNVLNTLVALARKKSDLMEPSLIQLSTLMRYVLYESNHHKIPLSREVEYLKNYIELQSLRFGDDLRLNIEIAPNLEGFEIEPMLLIPFVENAFKHGLVADEDAGITIWLHLDPAISMLFFKVENQIAPESDSKDPGSGIGLKNVSRRLQLLYQNKHSLSSAAYHNTFTTNLMIELG